MKHTFNVTLILVLIFLVAQISGLFIISQYIDIEASSEAGTSVPTDVAKDSPGGEPPEISPEDYWKYGLGIFASILLGTVVLLILIKFRMIKSMKLWFFLAVMFCLAKAIFPFLYKIPYLSQVAIYLAMVLAVALAYMKIWRHNIYMHNVAEILLYGGMAAYIVPLLNMKWAFLLLIGISIYDMYAVWKSKHMVKMAKFQSKSKMFAGLLIPYKKDAKIVSSTKDAALDNSKPVKSAILGGGDIAFPLFFTGTYLSMNGSYVGPAIITFTTTIALFCLLYFGKTNKFYPAMPFISAGCFIGYAIAYFI